MVEYTNIQDNSEEIMKCIVNCDTEKDQKRTDDNLLSSMPNEEEYIDEP
ncbi:hypothetical protein ACFPES_21135 [Paenibacillus sp. GCM10023248]|nr:MULTISPECIES: hypothetical protein [Bacillales]MDD9269562.1 hypothetical protein [Paenibacillus sp. MAHUQ-63]MDR6880807.1 hypothetical protein [Bacillus sp. 3255]